MRFMIHSGLIHQMPQSNGNLIPDGCSQPKQSSNIQNAKVIPIKNVLRTKETSEVFNSEDFEEQEVKLPSIAHDLRQSA